MHVALACYVTLIKSLAKLSVVPRIGRILELMRLAGLATRTAMYNTLTSACARRTTHNARSVGYLHDREQTAHRYCVLLYCYPCFARCPSLLLGCRSCVATFLTDVSFYAEVDERSSKRPTCYG